MRTPLEKPLMGGLGPIEVLDVVLAHLETDAGVAGETLVVTLNDKRVAVLDEVVRSPAPLVVGRDPAFTSWLWHDAWSDINFARHKGVPVSGHHNQAV